jgi:predicted small metal-binding protein
VAKLLRCGDVIPGCPAIIEGATEQEVMTEMAEHAKYEHAMPELSPEFQRTILAAMQDR